MDYVAGREVQLRLRLSRKGGIRAPGWTRLEYSRCYRHYRKYQLMFKMHKRLPEIGSVLCGHRTVSTVQGGIPKA